MSEVEEEVADIAEEEPKQKKSKEERLAQSIEDVTPEDVDVGVRELVDFLVYLLAPRKIFRWTLYLLLFLSIGYFYKVWMWVDVCVLENAGAPCNDEYSSLFTMSFPVDLGAFYMWMNPSEDRVNLSKSFFSMDFTHILMCFSGATLLGIAYALWRAVRAIARFVLNFFCRRFTDFKRVVASRQRRVLVRKTK